VLRNNNVYDNTAYDYSGLNPGTGDFSADPKFVDKVNGNLHIQPNSPCIDAGYNDVVQPGWVDMDGQPRIQGDHVDIGADEAIGCARYIITLTSSPAHGIPGGQVTITAHVTDRNNQPIYLARVDFTVTDGVIQSITNDLGVDGVINNPPVTGYGYTDDNGNVMAIITSDSNRVANVIASTASSCGPNQTTESLDVYFSNQEPVYLVFLIDVTGSTEERVEDIKDGITATVNYLSAQLRAQSRLFHVAGIKFSDNYQPNILDPSLPYSYGELFDFTTDIAAFNGWVNGNWLSGGVEYQLDILMFAKDLLPEAVPGLYIALATDEDSDSEPRLLRQDVATALTQVGCIVFIDPGRDIDTETGTWLIDHNGIPGYYSGLAVNGGAVEQEPGNLGTFTFQHMRQAVLGQ
jgi:hypothetical protein